MGAVLRYIAMLSLLPRFPASTTAKRLLERLEALGFDVDVRSVQRDLIHLKKVFPVVYKKGRPFKWSWAGEAPPLGSAGIDPVLAVTLVAANALFGLALPAFMRHALAPLLRASHGVLENTGGKPLEFAKRFRMLPKGPPLLPPEVQPSVFQAVADAVTGRCMLAGIYRPQGRPPAECLLEPLGLAGHGTTFYLVARRSGQTQIKTFLVHRFLEARVLDDRTEPDEGFDLDDFIARGGLGFAIGGPPVELVVRFRGSAVQVVQETPMSRDQTLERLDGDETRVRATVIDTRALRAWLLGFGNQAVIEGPPAMVADVARIVHAMAADYPKPSAG